MKKISILLLIVLIGFTSTRAQIAINTDGSAADNSAMLDIKSTTKGVLLPRMTNTQIQSIASPADGLLVYSTDDSKVYCYNSGDNEWKGIDYGSGTITPFVCGTSAINDSDGNTYNTVLIGSQCWMAENLNIGSMINGSSNQTDNGLIEKYCYSNTESNCTTYGGLYQWNEIMEYSSDEGVQGICPEGWHIPTDDEWKIMEIQLGMIQSQADAIGWRGTNEGYQMKSTSGWYNSGNGSNSSDFTAIPTGNRYGNGLFNNLDRSSDWWSSSEYSDTHVWNRGLSYDYYKVARYAFDKMYYGLSIRCLKN